MYNIISESFINIWPVFWKEKSRICRLTGKKKSWDYFKWEKNRICDSKI